MRHPEFPQPRADPKKQQLLGEGGSISSQRPGQMRKKKKNI